MFIRYFCRVRPEPGDALADLGFECFEAMKGAGLPVRVIPTRLADLTAGGGRWDQHGLHFICPVPTDYINVVCGEAEELTRLYTVGVKNVAIVIDDPEPEVVQHYSAVVKASSDITPQFLKGL